MLLEKATGVVCGLVLMAGCGGTAPPVATSDLPEPSAPTPAASATPEPAASAPEPAPAEPITPPEEEPVPTDSDKRDEFKAKPKRDPDGAHGNESWHRTGDLTSNALGFVAPVLGQQARSRLRVHFLDVGQGDSTLIECPNGEKILVDGGSGISQSSSPQGARDYLVGVLGASPTIDTLIVSHPDRDHYNAIPFLLQGVTVGQVQVVGPANEYSGPFVAWLAQIPDAQKTRITTESHDAVDVPNGVLDCGDASIHVLAVAARGTPDNSPKNSLSMVLLVTHGEFDAILTADATFLTEGKILGWYPHWWLEVEVLKLGHHGSSTTSSGQAWIDATSPEVAIASSGFANTHGHPREVVVSRAANHTVSAGAHAFRWYRTQTQFDDEPAYTEAIYGTGSNGTIVVESDGASYWVERER